MSKILYTDLFEYPDDAAAQVAYVSSSTPETFGLTTKGVMEGVGWTGEYIRAPKLTSGSAGKLKSISVYIKYVADTNIKAAIYDSSFNLLTNGTTEEKAVTSGQDGWMVLNFTTPPTVAATTVYYLAFWVSAEIKAYYNTETGGLMEYDNISYNGWPDPLVSDSSWPWELSVYATYVKDLQCYSESTIVQQGTYSLRIEAKQTESLNDTLTKTLVDHLDYSIQDKIFFWARATRTGSNFKLKFHDTGGNTQEHTVNIIEADKGQLEEWDISEIATADRDTIDKIIIEIINADADNTIYLDNMFSKAIVEHSYTWLGG